MVYTADLPNAVLILHKHLQLLKKGLTLYNVHAQLLKIKMKSAAITEHFIVSF